MIRLADPEYLLLLLALPLWLWGRRSLFRPLALPFSDVALIDNPTGKSPLMAVRIPPIFRTLGFVLLVAGLVRPQWVEERVEAEREGIEILLATDVSSSMSDRVMEKDRSNLEVVLDAMKRFAASRDSDRIGLLSFARFPKLVCPLTADGRALQGFLDTLRSESQGSPMDGTAIGAALAEAARRFCGEEPDRERRQGDEPARVVILVTDGEENRYSVDPAEAARLCRDLGIKVYIVAAAGSDKLERPDADEEGESPLLEAIARITEGKSTGADSADGMRKIYDRIDALERRPLEEHRWEESTDFFRWFLLFAGIVLLGEFLAARVIWVRVP